MDIRRRLIEMREEGYQRFTRGLVPNIPQDRILGIRIPELRKLAKEIGTSEEAGEFLSSLPHQYLEENNLHAMLISEIRDIDTCLDEIEHFLPFLDNWMTNDIMNPKALKKDLAKTGKHAHKWLQGESVYKRRYGMTTFIKFFLGDNLDKSAMEEISHIGEDDYYVQMAAAWYWSEAVVKNEKIAIAYLESDKLNPWIRRKAIQKAIESYRVPPETKEYLRSLR